MGSLPSPEQQIRNFSANLLLLLKDSNNQYHSDVIQRATQYLMEMTSQISSTTQSAPSSDTSQVHEPTKEIDFLAWKHE